MNELYNYPKIKAMVSFTKGEGFGRPLLEFSITGKPVIASNWSGQTDFLHPEMSVLLPGELTPVHKSVLNDWFMKEAKWFTVNYIYAMKILQSVENSYKDYKTKSENQRNYTKSNFTLDMMSDKLHSILSTIRVSEEIVLNLPKLKI
jgi:glycosyltransferase involved in cell wall biosynthesis